MYLGYTLYKFPVFLPYFRIWHTTGRSLVLGPCPIAWLDLSDQRLPGRLNMTKKYSLKVDRRDPLF